MQAHRMHVTVPEDRKVIVEFPDSVPPGQVELIVLVAAERGETSEKASEDALARRDTTVSELALDPRPFRELTLEERQARLRRLRGIGKGVLPSSEEFLREKQEEVGIDRPRPTLKELLLAETPRAEIPIPGVLGYRAPGGAE